MFVNKVKNHNIKNAKNILMFTFIIIVGFILIDASGRGPETETP